MFNRNEKPRILEVENWNQHKCSRASFSFLEALALQGSGLYFETVGSFLMSTEPAQKFK